MSDRTPPDDLQQKVSSLPSFDDLGVAAPLRRALAGSGYVQPTPIQQRAIPLLLAGKDLLGVAQTGTGKTAAFALPILQHLSSPGPRRGRGPSALILVPTRELAVQVATAVRTYGRHLNLREAVVFGGVGCTPQIKALRGGVDILVATPGRLLDLIGQGHAKLDTVSLLVLDEVDRMLDMGFIRDVRRIIAELPRQRQSMLFSATMPPEIARLAVDMLRDPERVEVAPAGTAVELVDQRVFHVAAAEKRGLMASLIQDPAMKRVIVFTRTKHGADKVAAQLTHVGIATGAIHGNKSQSARQRALEDFRLGRSRVLVATDIAARGIDVDGVTHIVNYELPNVPETYVHRIGRTARAGASGAALSFCDATERTFLRDIERLIRRSIAVAEPPPRLEIVTGKTPVAAAMPKTKMPPSKAPAGKPPAAQRAVAQRSVGKSGAAVAPRTPARSKAAGRPSSGRPERRRSA
ncbi:MAG: DEAD/DEAH box helicase [Rhodospirillales bacterium]